VANVQASVSYVDKDVAEDVNNLYLVVDDYLEA